MNDNNETEKENEIKLCVCCVVGACVQGRELLFLAFV